MHTKCTISRTMKYHQTRKYCNIIICLSPSSLWCIGIIVIKSWYRNHVKMVEGEPRHEHSRDASYQNISFIVIRSAISHQYHVNTTSISFTMCHRPRTCKCHNRHHQWCITTQNPIIGEQTTTNRIKHNGSHGIMSPDTGIYRITIQYQNNGHECNNQQWHCTVTLQHNNNSSSSSALSVRYQSFNTGHRFTSPHRFRYASHRRLSRP